jgi:aldehyde dehydrogenase (NAD(P)+)
VTHHSNGEQITEVHAAGTADIDDAVRAARAALTGPWSEISGTQRGELMRKLADLAEELTHDMASIDSWNNGTTNTPLRDRLGY